MNQYKILSFVLCVLIVFIGYRSINEQFKNNSIIISKLDTRLTAIDLESRIHYENFSKKLDIILKEKKNNKDSKGLSQNTNNLNLNELIDKQNLIIEELLTRIESIEDQQHSISNHINSDGLQNSGTLNEFSATEISISEENRLADLRMMKIDDAFLQEPENTQIGNKKSNEIMTAASDLKTNNPDFQEFTISNIDCRVSTCKIEILQPTPSHDPEMIMMELTTRLDDLSASFDINVATNQDGTSNITYYLTSN